MKGGDSGGPFNVECSDREKSKLNKEEVIMLPRSVSYRKMLGYVLVILIGCTLWCGAPGSLWAGGMLQSAPLNPEYIKYMKDKAAGKLQTVTEEGYPLGYIPPPLLLPSVKELEAKGVMMAPIVRALPATFDLRTAGGLTAVRDQGGCGSCWAFASFASLESYLKYKVAQTWDFSEQDLNQYHGFTSRECEGGNYVMSTAYLARWSGPVNESDMPYPYVTAAPGVPIQKHVQNVRFLPARASYTDNNLIKTAVQAYGAVYMSFQWNAANYKASTYSYYTTSTGGNHAVAIVGWNDNFSKTKFNTTPPGNGAFICKNSWGTSWGQSGYLYIYYYDHSLQASAQFCNADPVTNYSQGYEYDPLGWSSSLGWTSGDKTMSYFANIFKVRTNAKVLKAVSFYTAVPSAKYVIYVYDNVTAGNPKSGTLKKTLSGTLANSGYNTLKFSVPVTLTPNARFSVIVKLTTPGYNNPIPIEDRYTGYSDAANAYTGQSFVSHDNITWSDITTTWSDYTNVCLKAFGSAS
jgi:C1A family cysteine protease